MSTNENVEICSMDIRGNKCLETAMCYICDSENTTYYYFCKIHMPIDEAGFQWIFETLGPGARIGLVE